MLRLELTAARSLWLLGLGLAACTSHLDLGHDIQNAVTAPRNVPDASTPDAATADAANDAAATSAPDAAPTPDASTPDASTPDASTPDASTPDAGSTPTGPTCVGIPCFLGPVQVLATSLGNAKGLVVDADDVFWAATGAQALMVTPKDGSATSVNPTPTAGPLRVAIDDTNVYFTSAAGGYVATALKTSRGRIGPRLPPPITVLASGEAAPQSLVVASEGVYFTDDEAGTLRRVALDGSVVETIVSGLSVGTDLALDADSVYYADATAGEIHAVNRSSLANTRLAKGLDHPAAPVPRAGMLYFLELGSNSRLVGMPLAGGAVQVLQDHLDSPSGLAADTAALYVCTQGSQKSGFMGQILRFADDGQVNLLADNQAGPFAIAVDGSGVYWTTDTDSTLNSIAR
jgi:hypothetical protein